MHKKTLQEYEVVALASAAWDVGQTLVVYRAKDDGHYWVRSYNEMVDGRFEKIGTGDGLHM